MTELRAGKGGAMGRSSSSGITGSGKAWPNRFLLGSKKLDPKVSAKGILRTEHGALLFGGIPQAQGPLGLGACACDRGFATNLSGALGQGFIFNQ